MTATVAVPSHPEHLEEDYGGERPDWIAEGVWEPLKREMILSRAGILKDSAGQIADRYGLPQGRVIALIRSRKWGVQFEEAKQDLVNSSMLLNQRVHEVLHDKWSDPEKVAKMSPLDVMKAAKLGADMALNLSNGTAGGSPGLQINFADVKAIMNVQVKPPGSGA